MPTTALLKRGISPPMARFTPGHPPYRIQTKPSMHRSAGYRVLRPYLIDTMLVPPPGAMVTTYR